MIATPNTSIGTFEPDLEKIPHRRFLPEDRVNLRRMIRALPTGILGALLVIAAVESFIVRCGPVFQDPVCFSWMFSARAARHEAIDAQILCLGDSLAKHGLVPAVIEGATGRRTYNLAVAAGPVLVTEILLKRALEARSHPSAIVFDLKPGLLAGGPQYRLREWQELLTPGEAMALLRAYRSVTFASELVLGYVVPSFRARHEIRSSLREAVLGESSRLVALNALCRRNWTINRGANLATPSASFHGEVSEAQHEEHLSGKFTAQRVNAAAARRLVTLAANRGIRAYLVIPPLTPALFARQTTTGSAAKYDAFLKSLQAQNPALTILDARDSGYPAEVFVDPIHLDAQGAFTLSTDVAEVMRVDLEMAETALRTNRWIHLSTYHEVGIPESIEDVEQSRRRLGITITP